MADSVTVIVDDDHLGLIDELAEHLRATGTQVHQVLDALSIITGITGEVTAAQRLPVT
jgi:hypothetical protein